MATGTLSVSLNLAATFGSYTRNDNESVTPTLNVQGEGSGIMATSTTAANVDVTNVPTLGWAFFKNLDTTNNIDIGIVVSAAFQAFATLLPGEIGCFRLKQGVTLQAKAQAGTPNLQYWILNN